MEFTVKDSGQRIEYKTGMRRDIQEGKPRYDLILPERGGGMLKRWAEHMRKGAEKYGERNWELAETEEEYKRFRQSAIRHFIQWFDGECDEDHAAAVFFNIQAAEYVAARMQEAVEAEDVIPFSIVHTFTEAPRQAVDVLTPAA